MDNGKDAVAARLLEWTQKISEQKESGLSVSEYCQMYDIPKSTYGYWSKRVRQAKEDDTPNEIVDVTSLVKEGNGEVVSVARAKNTQDKSIHVLCFKISQSTSEKAITDVLKAFINA